MVIKLTVRGGECIHIDPLSVENYYFSTKNGEYPYTRVRMKSGDVYWITPESYDDLNVYLAKMEQE